MSNEQKPVVLELAPLPREQIGPFLLLGLDKDASALEIETHWAQRIIWARKGEIAIQLSDINWAREVLTDPERRVRADVTSLNTETADKVLSHLARQHGLTTGGELSWQPLDTGEPTGNPVPPVELPSPEQVLSEAAVPPIAQEMPAVAALLAEFVEQPLDPWNLTLLPSKNQERAP